MYLRANVTDENDCTENWRKRRTSPVLLFLSSERSRIYSQVYFPRKEQGYTFKYTFLGIFFGGYTFPGKNKDIISFLGNKDILETWENWVSFRNLNIQQRTIWVTEMHLYTTTFNYGSKDLPMPQIPLSSNHI